MTHAPLVDVLPLFYVFYWLIDAIRIHELIKNGTTDDSVNVFNTIIIL